MSTTKKTRPRPNLKLDNLGGRAASPVPTSQLTSDRVSKESRVKLKDNDLEFLEELGAGAGGKIPFIV
jgi:hypothetical protein